VITTHEPWEIGTDGTEELEQAAVATVWSSGADASLIAASPELLAALKAMLNPDAEGDIDQAMAAIRKAEGRTS